MHKYQCKNQNSSSSLSCSCLSSVLSVCLKHRRFHLKGLMTKMTNLTSPMCSSFITSKLLHQYRHKASVKPVKNTRSQSLHIRTASDIFMCRRKRRYASFDKSYSLLTAVYFLLFVKQLVKYVRAFCCI